MRRQLKRLWQRFVHEPWYWLKCAVWYRHNVIRIKTLPPTWTDRDERMLHAAFQLLKDFVEYEKPFDWFDTEASPHREDWQEIRWLYDWWTKERPARQCPYTALGDKYTKEQLLAAGDQDDAFEDEDQKMLERLVAVRGHLWT